jgi:hypothetical protein
MIAECRSNIILKKPRSPIRFNDEFASNAIAFRGSRFEEQNLPRIPTFLEIQIG